MKRPSTFGLALLAIALLGFAVRLGYVLALAVDEFGGDAFYYHHQANHLADGSGFIEPLKAALQGAEVPSAYHPPLFPVVLAVASVVGAQSTFSHQIVNVLFGVATVVIVGLLAKRLCSAGAGLTAAVIAALHPGLWASDGLLMSETLFAALIAGGFLTAVTLVDSPSVPNALALGVVLGLAALTRGEGIVFALLLLALGMVVGLQAVPTAARVRLLGIATVAMLIVVMPWIVRNLATFEHPVLLSTNAGATIGAANCPSAYTGWARGYFDMSCWDQPNPEDESEADRYWRSRGLDYARVHSDQVPGVLAARVGRVWSLYRPMQMIEFDTNEGRRWPVGALGLSVYYWLIPFAVVGGVALWGRRRPVWPLLVPFPVVTLLAAAFYGVTRFRVSAEVSLVVLGAVGITAAVGRARRKTPAGR